MQERTRFGCWTLKKTGAIVVSDTLSTTVSATSIGGRSASKAPTTTTKAAAATATAGGSTSSKAVEKPAVASSKVVKATKAPVWTTTHSSIGTPVVGKQ